MLSCECLQFDSVPHRLLQILAEREHAVVVGQLAHVAAFQRLERQQLQFGAAEPRVPGATQCYCIKSPLTVETGTIGIG